MQTYDVAVIGLGAMGASALCALARRGVKAIGFDQFEPGHGRGSSHGESRLIRLAYFEDPSYVPLVRLAYDAWARLEAATGGQVLTRTGIIEAGVPGSALVAGSLRSAVENDIPHERLTGAQIAARFPAFAFPADWEGLYQADGGVLQPEKAIGLYVRLARQAGASVRANTRVLPPEPIGDRVIIRTEAGEIIEAGSVIVAAGPWIGGMVPDLAPHLTLSRQLLFWFDPADKALVTPDRMPAFLFDSGDDILYGMPDLYGTGVKAASHLHGNTLSSGDAQRSPPTPEDARPIQDALARYIPAAFGPVTRSAACTYTNTADEHFVVGLHPDHPQIVIASPCSGHGFKFSSILGEALADLATTGESDKPIGLFDPKRVLG